MCDSFCMRETDSHLAYFGVLYCSPLAYLNDLQKKRELSILGCSLE